MKFKILILFILLFNLNLFSHGTNYIILKDRIGIEAKYDDGTPMGDSDVNVYSPEDKKDPQLKGKTSADGKFFFLPLSKGEWIVKVDDGMGHAVKAIIKVDKNKVISENKSGFTIIQKIIMVISILWGFLGTALYFKK